MDTMPPPRHGAPLTLRAVIDEYMTDIRRSLERRGVRGSDIDDVAQEVLHSIAKGLHRFDPGRATPRAWIEAIVRNQVSNHRRRAYRRQERSSPAETFHGLPSEAQDPEQRLIEMDDRALLVSLLQTISREKREVVIACDLEGRTVAEVAATLSVPVPTLHSRLRVGRAELAEGARRVRARQQRRRRALLPGMLGCHQRRRRSARQIRRSCLERNARRATRVESGARQGSTVARPPLPTQRRATWATKLSRVVGIVLGACLLSQPDRRAEPRGARDADALITASVAGENAPRYAAAPRRDAPAPTTEQGASSRDEGGAAGSSAPRRAPERPSAVTGGATDTAEHELVQLAVAALTVGDIRGARQLLQRHRSQFPSGRLARQRDVLLLRCAPNPRRSASTSWAASKAGGQI